MTESDWDDATDPQPLLQFLRDIGWESERKLRLFCCACCRRVWPALDAGEREALRVAERHADGEAGPGSLGLLGRRDPPLSGATFLARGLPREVSHLDLALGTASFCATCGASPAGSYVGERAAQARLLRCLVGSPFWRATAGAARPPGEVYRLALAAYKGRVMPAGTLEAALFLVLADALEEAGCDDAVLRAHLRSEGPHWRGCFALDAVLGKS
jgi:hypothetical protein